ncbi:MAG: HD domain-containing protein [Proteobacteria bacterium]|nr:HD domain-containing protein [Pseudomonadota bacterium]
MARVPRRAAAAGSDDAMALILEYMAFVDQAPHSSDVYRLMDRVLRRTRELTEAEAGTIFIVRGRGARRHLEPGSIQNDAIPVAKADFNVPVDDSSIAGHVALTGETLLIDDLYDMPANLSYSFNPRFDAAVGYLSRSVMCFALKNLAGRVIGVIQLINRRPKRGAAPIPFESSQAELVRVATHLVGNALERTDMMERIRTKNAELSRSNRLLAGQRARIIQLQAETEDAFKLSINLLARAAEIHDQDTARHVARVNECSYALARHAGMPADFCNEIRYSAQLHDVGKMSINTAILLKSGALTRKEREELMRHPVYGFEILSHSDRLKMAALIARHHHEKWDGTGYPDRLAGDGIPIEARIVALADIYDALRSRRAYKADFSHARAVDIILKGDERIDPGAHFDPGLLAIFARRHQDFAEIYAALAGES